MLIFSNTVATGTFSVVLRDKLTQTNPHLFLKMTKIDDKSHIYFHLDNESTSDRYETYTISLTNLKEGQYIAEFYQGYPIDTDDCDITDNTIVVLGVVYECNPVTLEATLTLEDEMVITDQAVIDQLIYSTVARIEGLPYNTVYRNESQPEYYVYNE